jgi:hypothetical protein
LDRGFGGEFTSGVAAQAIDYQKQAAFFIDQNPIFVDGALEAGIGCGCHLPTHRRRHNLALRRNKISVKTANNNTNGMWAM